jgi:hypothetical protein
MVALRDFFEWWLNPVFMPVNRPARRPVVGEQSVQTKSQLPELFNHFDQASDVICPTPWNILGMMIANGAYPQEEKGHEEEPENIVSHTLN